MWLLGQGSTWKALSGSSATWLGTSSCRRQPKDSRLFPSAYGSIQTWIVPFLRIKGSFFHEGREIWSQNITVLTGFFINYLLTCSWKPFSITKCLLKKIRGEVLSVTETRLQNFNNKHKVLKNWALEDQYHLQACTGPFLPPQPLSCPLLPLWNSSVRTRFYILMGVKLLSGNAEDYTDF